MTEKWVRLIPEDLAALGSVVRNPPAGGANTFLSYEGHLRPQPGDATFPFVKDPPQLFGPSLYTENALLEDVTANNPYVEAPAVDVRGARHLMLYVDLRQRGGEVIPPDPTFQGSLSILPEAGIKTEAGQVIWWPVGVVDAILAEDGIPSPGYSERNVFQTELIWNPRAGISPAPLPLSGRFRLVLAFDVDYYFSFRFRFGALNGEAELTSFVSLGR